MPALRIQLPGAAPVEFELKLDVVAIGRRDSNTIQIDDASVSGSHAVLTRREDGDYTVEDLGSTNGTRLNGRDLTVAQSLRNGDKLRLGKIEALYASEVPPPAASPDDETMEMPIEALPPAQPPSAAVRAAKGKPEDFVNAAPFEMKTKTRDPVATALYALAALAMVAFVVAIIMVFLLEAPKLAL